MPIHKPLLDLEQARSVSLVRLCQVEGVGLKKHGRIWVGLCPVHKEKTPSFTIFSDNHYKCFGCGVEGDSIAFLRLVHGYSFLEAVRSLSADLDTVTPVLTQKRTLPPLHPARRVVDRDLVETWVQNLNKRPEKKKYLYSRLFTDETIDTERWGYNEGYYSFPVWDGRPGESDILAVRFRAGEGQEPRYKGLFGFNESVLYNKYAIIGKLTALIFFGELDAQLATQDGFPAVSPTNGKSVWLPEWTDYFERAERVIIIPDRDDPKKLIPERKVTLKTLNTKEKNENRVITEYESSLIVAEAFSRRAVVKQWDDRFPGKDYNANRVVRMSAKDFSDWTGIVSGGYVK